MSGRRIPVFPILIMLAIIAAGYGIYKNVEFEEVEYEVEQSEEARKNRFLAAGRLLESEGFTFRVAYDRRIFSSLNSVTTGVLWMSDINQLEDKREAEQILSWIESGGIFMASSIGDDPFSDTGVPGWLLQQLGIVALDDDDEKDVAFQAAIEAGNEGLTLPDADLQNPALSWYQGYDPYFRSSDELPDDARTVIDSPFLIHNALGNGYYTFYADHEQFDNDRIDDNDLGYLLLWLTQPASNKSIAMVFRPASKPGLFTVLWSKFTLAICLFAVVLVGFLRWASSRLGPVEQELPPIKNNIMAHLEARGEYWHRHKYTDKVLENIQQATLERISIRRSNANAGASDTDSQAAIKQVTEILRCTPAQAEEALYGTAKNNMTLLRTSRALQRLNHRRQFKSK